jgi:hypothetical protein
LFVVESGPVGVVAAVGVVEGLYGAGVGSGNLGNHLQGERVELVLQQVDVVLGEPPPDAV